MRYASIRRLDISNGEGLGVTLFTQGCPFHCKNCFNPETHDFDGGKEYTIDTKNAIVSLINRAQIKRFSILGGEPLIERNKEDMIDLCSSIKEIRPDIKIWVYTGNIFENVKDDWYELLYNYVDVLVDGPYVDSKRDLRLKFRGSSNQRVIDVHKTYYEDKVIELI